MSGRVKAVAPLAASTAVVAFLWSEFTLNFNLHWFTVADGVFGTFGLPEQFQVVLPASFVAWGLYFALRADRTALRKTLIASTTGTIGAIVIMTLGPAFAGRAHGSRCSAARCWASFRGCWPPLRRGSALRRPARRDPG